MRELKPQKLYVSEEDRRRDQRPDREPDESGLFNMFNNWASDKTQEYRRAVYGRSSDLEIRIENGLEQDVPTELRATWSKVLEELEAARTELKVAFTENAVKEVYKAKQLNTKLEQLEKKCPF